MAKSRRDRTTAEEKTRIDSETARKQLAFLLGYYRPYAGRTIVALLFMLPASAISLLFPRLTGDLIDTVTKSGSSDQLYTVGLSFLGLLIVQAVIGYFVSVTMARTTERVIAALRTDLFDHIIRLPLTVLTERRIGELSSRLSSDLTQIQETFSFSVMQILRQIIFLIGSIAIIISTSVQLTVPILVALPVIVVVALYMGRKIRALSTKTQDALARSSTIVEETLQSISAVKTYVQEGYETKRYHATIDENVRLAISGARLRAIFVTFIIFTIFGGIAGVILYGAGLVMSGAVTMGQLLSFLMYAMFVGGALGSVAEQFGQIQKSLGASVRMRELMQAPVEELGEDAPRIRLTSVQLDHVSFSYPERADTTVIDNVSLQIAPGERVAFVGSSGAGKSTTAALIQRLYDPTQGTISYDWTDAHALSLAQVRLNIGIVPQDIVLFGGTIDENIRYGKIDATEEEVVAAARAANAMEFIERFPEGMQARVGERGIKLSGGQRQRIAIARALLKNPPILILDEATSSLDADSERLISEALERLMEHRTTIIIAHRLSTVRRCDRIYVFDSGRIVESGAHDELFANADGKYRRWCDLQFIQ
ncbi:MAG: ATP-binding cassette domain-containing protein [Bacteroidetes bacterium]|nr:ATP-binding cassette domain-containing protein [Bacteroidota bacterium]